MDVDNHREVKGIIGHSYAACPLFLTQEYTIATPEYGREAWKKAPTKKGLGDQDLSDWIGLGEPVGPAVRKRWRIPVGF